MSLTEQYLRDLLYEAKEIRRLLDRISSSLNSVDSDTDRIKNDVNDIKRALERRR